MSTQKGMLAARVFAVVVIVGVGAAAFRLSFATLRDLAVLAHIPGSDAWLFPLIVDGTIVQATLAWLVLAHSPQRRWFAWVLIIGAVVSVAGNSLHAVAAGRSLPAWACALVAAVAPIGLLVDTHGLAVLFRAAHQDSAVEPEPVPVPVPVPDVVAGESADAALEVVEVVAPEPAVSVPVRPVRPVTVPVLPVRPVRPVRSVQEVLPIAVPARS
jgi:hypothetical protein